MPTLFNRGSCYIEFEISWRLRVEVLPVPTVEEGSESNASSILVWLVEYDLYRAPHQKNFDRLGLFRLGSSMKMNSPSINF